MDKRYFLIIIIICICVVNLYIIANVSDIVGSASVDVGDYTISLPKGFSLYDDDSTQVLLSNPDSKIDIQFFSKVGDKDTFEKKVGEINNNSEFRILSNGTIDNNGVLVDSLFYQRTDNSKNFSIFYFTKDNHNFRIIVKGFDYDSQKDEIIDLVSDIITSIRVNYKVQK